MTTDAPAGWEARTPMPTTRHDVACFVEEDQLLVVAGFDDDTNYAETEVYRHRIDEWDRSRAPIPTARGLLGADRLDGACYVVGGKRLRREFVETGSRPQYDVFDLVDRYDPATDEWTRVAPLARPRAGLSAAACDGLLYAVGGSVPHDPETFPTPGDVTDAVEVYDPATDAWTVGPALPEPRSSPAVESVGGRVYVLGGYSAEGVHDDVFVLAPDGDGWERAPPLPAPRRDAASTVHDGRVYLFAGLGADEEYLSSTGRYDPATGTWEPLPPLPVAKAWSGAAVADGRAVVVGGARPVDDGFAFLDEVHTLPVSVPERP